MTLPNVPYAGLTAPQMAFLDQTFAATAALGIVPCSASGTNIITLTPNANTPTISAYANYIQFSFVAVNTANSAVTLQVGALPPLPLYLPDGTTQAANGTIQGQFPYVVIFNQALNSGGGGFVIVSGLVNQTHSTIASGGNVAIGASAADYITISGTSGIGSFDTVISGTRRTLTFSSSATILNSAAIILPGNANISTAPGDTSIFISEGSGNWRCIAYQRAALSPRIPINIQTFTTVGANTYTPTAGMSIAIVEMVGGGGGSGGVATTGASNTGAAGGGGGGGYSRKHVTAAAIGASQTVTIGVAGSGGAPGNNGGGPGGNTVFGAIFTAVGGSGGAGGANQSTVIGGGTGGAAGNSASGDVNFNGSDGGTGLNLGSTSLWAAGGNGGASYFAGSTTALLGGASQAAVAGKNYGGGAAGGSLGQNQTQISGASGASGACIITEF